MAANITKFRSTRVVSWVVSGYSCTSRIYGGIRYDSTGYAVPLYLSREVHTYSMKGTSLATAVEHGGTSLDSRALNLVLNLAPRYGRTGT